MIGIKSYDSKEDKLCYIIYVEKTNQVQKK